MPNSKIVVVGSCMIDFVSYTPRLPKEGETIRGSKFVTNFGGKGANQCVAAAKLGGNTTLIASVGDDIWGGKYIENLKNEKVETKFVKQSQGATSGIAQITVSDAGQNLIVIIAGANLNLTPEDVLKSKEEIENAEVLVLQLETAIEVAIEAMKLCKGVSILNGAPALQNYDKQLLTLPTIFCVNESEASIFTGLPVNNKNEAEKAAVKLIQDGCQSVLLTLGSEGALFMDKSQKVFVPCPKTHCVDSTGAGDSFIGALAFLLANYKELPIRKQIELACVAASDSVTRPGTQISFPGPEIFKGLI